MSSMVRRIRATAATATTATTTTATTTIAATATAATATATALVENSGAALLHHILEVLSLQQKRFANNNTTRPDQSDLRSVVLDGAWAPVVRDGAWALVVRDGAWALVGREETFPCAAVGV